MHEHVRNDLWSMDVRDCTTMQVKTKGDAPVARVGHASAIMDRIMLVWGGDTKVKQDDYQDEGLYILDLSMSDLLLDSCPLTKQEPKNGPVYPSLLDLWGDTVTRYVCTRRNSTFSAVKPKESS